MRFVDEVIDGASGVDWRRILVAIVAAVPYAIAWLVGKIVLGLLVALSWVIAGAKAGYRTARGDR